MRNWGAFFGILLLPLAPLKAQEWDQAAILHNPKSIAYYQLHDQRLHDVGWKLIHANASFCERARPSTGLQLQDATTFGAPDIARQALKLERDFAVATSAVGSPAQKSGALPQNREITHLGTVDLNALPVDARARWKRLTRVHDLLDELAAGSSEVTLTFASGETATITPTLACAARFELAGDSDTLVANKTRVLVGIKSEIFAFREDTFASGIAHELAHIVLGHTAWLDRNGRTGANTRQTEREADRLMPWLLANAGYDPEAAVRFFEEFRPSSGGVLFFKGSHPKWRERAKAVAAEVPKIKELMAREGRADWRTHFRREIDPEKGL